MMQTNPQPMELKQQIGEACHYITKKSALKPEIGIILGTGLGNTFYEDIEIDAVIPYTEIPHFPISTVEFHAGKFIVGELCRKDVVIMQGRFHYYEGYSMKQITFPIRVMRQIGVHTLIITCASGGINPAFVPGDIMLITDHINLLGDNPLIGVNDTSLGPRFPDMSEPYAKQFIQLTEEIAVERKIRIQKGVFAAMTGPSLETAAEYRFLRIIGADAVGMSTVPENLVAVHSGMKVLGLTVITDLGTPENLKPVNVSEVIKIAQTAVPQLRTIISSIIEQLN